MDSALRPRDIQARIRAGESPEAVAAVAEVSLERIMGYAVPVLAEREHICQQARRSGLRRKHASGPGRLLGPAVDEHLRSNGWDPDAASWDSWRREDGRWSVTVTASRGGEPATFLFDAPGRYAFAHDDAARRLVGDEPPLSVAPEADEPRSVPPLAGRTTSTARGLMALHREDGDPARTDDEDVSHDEVVRLGSAPGEATTDTETAAPPEPPESRPRVSALDRLRRQRVQAVEPLPFDAEPVSDHPFDDGGSRQLPDGGSAAAAQAEADEDVEAIARVMSTEPQHRPVAVGEPGGDGAAGSAGHAGDVENGQRRRKGSRRAVPSWDEIMFGSKPSS